MVIVLKMRGDVIIDARYTTYPCPAAHACGQYVAERVEGMTTEEAAKIDEGIILKGVGNMPLGREHCPRLAAEALANALASR
jgi:NifU-like protein involved in Fe-S cluster formation